MIGTHLGMSSSGSWVHAPAHHLVCGDRSYTCTHVAFRIPSLSGIGSECAHVFANADASAEPKQKSMRVKILMAQWKAITVKGWSSLHLDFFPSSHADGRRQPCSALSSRIFPGAGVWGTGAGEIFFLSRMTARIHCRNMAIEAGGPG